MFRAFNFRHVAKWQTLFNGENFLIYGMMTNVETMNTKVT